MQEEAGSIVSVKDFKKELEKIKDIQWGKDPSPSRRVKVSTTEEKYETLPKLEGFFIKGIKHFFPCYEFYQGVAIHTDKYIKSQKAVKKAAKRLGANAFFFN